MVNSVIDNYRSVFSRIENAYSRSSHQDRGAVSLVCVSKRQPLDKLQTLIDSDLFAIGGPSFGENFVQEFEGKYHRLKGNFSAHCIGHLQTNKVRKAVEIFDVIQTVDSFRLASKINSEGERIGRKIDCFLQVNISEDSNKGGFMPEDLDAKQLESLLSLSNISITGLMTITKLYEVTEDVRNDFVAMRLLRDSLESTYMLNSPLLLSMGMSADFELAIEEGANLVRVGSAIFGQRES